MLYWNSVTQENSGCVGRKHKTVKLLNPYWSLLASREPRGSCGWFSSTLYFLQLFIQMCADMNSNIPSDQLLLPSEGGVGGTFVLFFFLYFSFEIWKFQKQLVWNRYPLLCVFDKHQIKRWNFGKPDVTVPKVPVIDRNGGQNCPRGGNKLTPVVWRTKKRGEIVSERTCRAVLLIPNGVKILKNIQETLWTTSVHRKDNFWEKALNTVVMELLCFLFFETVKLPPFAVFLKCFSAVFFFCRRDKG